ncbi:MAG: type II toxin-antitoxin system VapC family toxin [Deltaproteobacteria bacterium]|nr:type II toxin-antitoxin system VapC family toxin [Deltaproteobacteria bacterium]
MNSPYLDTSALVKLYYPEPESEDLSRWILEKKSPLIFTSLHELELRNALSLKVYRRELTRRRSKAIERIIRSDLKDGVLWRPPVAWGEVFSNGFKLLKHAGKIGSRSLDLLHVAAALELSCDSFLTYDDRQSRLAKAAGLKIRVI